MTAWRRYQNDVADLFRSLGHSVSIEAEADGVRAKHRIDVQVKFELWGVKILWIVECKYWHSRVSKEKVLVLHQIAQDVGADRAFLFCERSFQPGAIAAARSTNISLTSLSDLRETVREDMTQLQLRAALKQLLALDERAKGTSSDEHGDLHPIHGMDFDEATYLSGCCLFLERAAVRAIAGEFPVYLSDISSGKSRSFTDASALAAGLAVELDHLNTRILHLEATAQKLFAKLQNHATAFENSVNSLLQLSEYVLTELDSSSPNADRERMRCLSAMQAVGRAAEVIRHRGGQEVQQALRAVMRSLIDTVYLDLTKPSIEVSAWRKTRASVEQKLAIFQNAITARTSEAR